MIFDLQKASVWKRISAYIFDMILIVILAAGAASILSMILDYDSYAQQMNDSYAKYGITFDGSVDYESLSEEELKKYEDAYEAMNKDEDVLRVFNMLVNLTLVITTVSILLAYLALEFVVPLLFKNGQTLGKKIFGIGLMRTDGVRINTVMLFVRTILGKYTIETMIPVLIAIMFYFGSASIIELVILGLILLLQVIMMIATRTNSAIHDKLANTVAVDISSQMIFDSEEAMIAYKQKVHAEKAARQDY